MAAVNNQLPSIQILRGLIPPARAAHFLRAAGADPIRAFALHEWNESVGGAFYPSLQKVELALRVRVERALSAVYGASWFIDQRFLGIKDHAVHGEIATASHRLMSGSAPVNADGLMQKASFGLWVGLLRPIFNPPVWSGQLRTAFPMLPVGIGRADLAKLASRAAALRNRIDHHEPLIGLDLSAYHSDVMQLLEWIDRRLAARAGIACSVPQLLRTKP